MRHRKAVRFNSTSVREAEQIFFKAPLLVLLAHSLIAITRHYRILPVVEKLSTGYANMLGRTIVVQ